MTYEELMKLYGDLPPTSPTIRRVREAILDAGMTYMEPLARLRVRHAPLPEILCDPDLLMIADVVAWPEPHKTVYATAVKASNPRHVQCGITRRQHKASGNKGKWRARQR